MFRLPPLAQGEINMTSFPKVIRIEPSSLCNLKCIHCPRGTYKKPIGKILGWFLFKKILKEIKQNISFCKVAVLYHGGEPLLNKNLFKMILALKKAGIEKIKIDTNGLLLNKKNCKAIINSGLDVLFVSIDGDSEKQNLLIRNSDFKIVSGNIKLLCQLKKELGKQNPSIIISNTVFSESKNKVFLVNCFNGLDVAIQTNQAIVWPNFFPNKKFFCIIEKFKEKQFVCDHLENTLTIRANGDVVPCCYDLTSTCILGNIKKNSIKEIWNGKKLAALRKKINVGNKSKLCENCFVLGTGKFLVLKEAFL